MTASRDGGPAADQPDNRMLIRRLFALAWRYRLHCLQVLGIQLVLLTLGIAGLGLTGIGVDYVRYKVAGTPLSANRLHLTLPADWPPLQVLGLLAGLILLFALIRASTVARPRGSTRTSPVICMKRPLIVCSHNRRTPKSA